MEYFDWLEQEAEEQRREERQEQIQRFLENQVRAAEETIVKAALTRLAKDDVERGTR